MPILIMTPALLRKSRRGTMDKGYWDKYYNEHYKKSSISKNSTFADFCHQKYLSSQKTIVELGCGNGRDAKFFAKNNHLVYALDQSINNEIIESNNFDNLNFIEEDFVHCNFDFCKKIDVFYSRFTIHSITSEDQNYLIPKIYNILNPKGLFCIEVRTINDPKFKKGKHISDTTYFYDGHMRRFIDSQQFLKSVLSLGFKIKYFEESNNLSIYKDDNPVLMRIILEV